jgi:predicted nucleic acid-binding protein
LFDHFVFNNDDILFLYINPCIQNELTNLLDSNKIIKFYNEKHPELAITKEDAEQMEASSVLALEKLIENEVLIVLNANKESSLQQLKLFKELGVADAINVTLANEYGISFLTVDNRLVNNMQKNLDKLSNIQNIYYTSPSYRTY